MAESAWRIAGDRDRPIADRVAAIRDLAQGDERQDANGVGLWRDFLRAILFDESDADQVRIAAAEAAVAFGSAAVNHPRNPVYTKGP